MVPQDSRQHAQQQQQQQQQQAFQLELEIRSKIASANPIFSKPTCSTKKNEEPQNAGSKAKDMQISSNHF
ncbi:hypothetical protein RCJ22_12770 [Vibrio sp. FNV 38]|nr:hypothetical protein [Vibrio sp. FNV 38]